MLNRKKKKKKKKEPKNAEYQKQHCKAVSEYVEGDSILFRNYNFQNKWQIGVVKKNG